MYRVAKGHLSQWLVEDEGRGMMSYKYNVLNISNLCKCAENRVFATLWASVGVEMLNMGDACRLF